MNAKISDFNLFLLELRIWRSPSNILDVNNRSVALYRDKEGFNYN